MWLRFTCAKSPILRAMCNYEQKWLVGGAQYVQEPGTIWRTTQEEQLRSSFAIIPL